MALLNHIHAPTLLAIDGLLNQLKKAYQSLRFPGELNEHPSIVSYIKILKDELFANHKLQNDIGFQIQSKCVALCALREE